MGKKNTMIEQNLKVLLTTKGKGDKVRLSSRRHRLLTETKMLSERTGHILKSIVQEYIVKAVPVPSQSIAREAGIRVSPATVRNEMAHLEQEGYILRPHTSAGSVPSDKGYRFYVESLEDVSLSPAEQRLISHLFHQAESEVGEWLSLAAELMARMAQNVAIVTIPRPAASKLKHLELVALQDSLVLVVLVLHGAKLKQKLINFEQIVPQNELSQIAGRLNDEYANLTGPQISARDIVLTPAEKEVSDYIVRMMRAEDGQDYEEPYLDGWHFMLNQPEFADSRHMLSLVALAEQRSLLKIIMPARLESNRVRVTIGREHKDEAFHNYSVVVSRYGLPDEATGTVGVVGPTRMPYAHTISTVGYLAAVLSRLMAALYGKELPTEPQSS